MMPTLLFCTGPAGAGKTTFIKDYLLKDNLFHNLRSATTRKMRPQDNESEGNPYFFRDEEYFANRDDFATYLFVNENTWRHDGKKWLYGVPKFEVLDNLGKNLVYDVIQPCYVAQMIDWVNKNGLRNEYNIKIAWVVPPENEDNSGIITSRANMPNDAVTRKKNTCTINDILNANLSLDYILCPKKGQYDPRLLNFIALHYDNMMHTR